MFADTARVTNVRIIIIIIIIIIIMVDIQSATAVIRRGRKKDRKKPRQKYNGLPYSIGRP